MNTNKRYGTIALEVDYEVDEASSIMEATSEEQDIINELEPLGYKITLGHIPAKIRDDDNDDNPLRWVVMLPKSFPQIPRYFLDAKDAVDYAVWSLGNLS